MKILFFLESQTELIHMAKRPLLFVIWDVKNTQNLDFHEKIQNFKSIHSGQKLFKNDFKMISREF